jgi:hypothetical protein
MKVLSKLLLLSASALLISSCNLVPGKKSTEQTSSAISATSSESSSSLSESEAGDHCEIVTCGDEFAIGTGSGGWKIDDHKDEFLSYLNTSSGVNLFADYNDLANIYIQNHNNDTSRANCHLSIGTGSYRGKLFLRTTKKIKKVAVTFSAYYKTTATPPYEADAKLFIEDTEYLPTLSEELPEPTKRVEYVYETPSDIVKFSNEKEKQRVFIDKLEFYY